MKRQIRAGQTDVSLQVFVQDSASTTGAGKTGIAYNAAGLKCYYARNRAAAAPLALAAQTPTGPHTDGGWCEIDATNMPGFYRLDLADAICAAGADSVSLCISGASGMAPVAVELELVDFGHTDPLVNDLGTYGAGTAGEALLMARQAAVGKEVTDQAARTRKVYALDGTTLLKTLTYTSSGDGKTITRTPS